MHIHFPLQIQMVTLEKWKEVVLEVVRHRFFLVALVEEDCHLLAAQQRLLLFEHQIQKKMEKLFQTKLRWKKETKCRTRINFGISNQINSISFLMKEIVKLTNYLQVLHKFH